MMAWSRFTRFIPLSFLIVASWVAAGCQEDSNDPKGGVTILQFEADPPELAAPGDVTVSWRTAGAESIRLSVDDAEVDLEDPRAAEGSISLHLAATSNLELEAHAAAGAIVRKLLTVPVGPAAPLPTLGEFSAPAQVEADEMGVATASLSWSGVAHADALLLEGSSLDPIPLDPEAASGTIDVQLREDTVFTLIARNVQGETTLTATVEVIDLPVLVRFEADRGRAGSGEEVGLLWETEGTVDVELFVNGEPHQGWDRAQTSGTIALPIWMDSRIELVAWNELGTSVRDELEIQVGSPILLDFAGSVSALWLGESIQLSWLTQGGSGLELREQGSGQLLYETTSIEEIAGSFWEWMPAESGSFTVDLTVSNTSGVTSSEGVSFTAGTGPFIAFFTAQPEQLSVGDELELAWEVYPDPAGGLPAVRLEDDGGGSEPVDAAGTRVVTAHPAGPRIFTLTASTTDPRSLPAVSSVEVEIHPLATVTFTATPTLFDDSIYDEVQLSWTTADAATVHIDWEAAGEVSRLLDVGQDQLAAGSFSFAPRDAGTLRMVSTNALGRSTVREIPISVAPTEVLELSTSPTTITQGQPVTLTWRTRMTDEVRLSLPGGAFLREEITAPYVDIRHLGGTHLPMEASCGASIATAGCGQLHLPFDFPYGGGVGHSARIYTTGVISFNEAAARASIAANMTFPTGPTASWIHLAPFWDALAWDTSRYPVGNVHYLHRLDPAGDSLVIQWADIGFDGPGLTRASVSFQVVLWKDGRFEYRYGPTNARDTSITASRLAGSSATIGYQLLDESASDVIAYLETLPRLGDPAHRTFAYRQRPSLSKNGTLLLHPYPEQSTVSFTMEALRGENRHSRTVTLHVARKPLVELSPFDPAPAELDSVFRLGWTTFNADRVEVFDAQDVKRCEATAPALVAESFCELSESTVGNYTYRVRASGPNGAIEEVPFRLPVYAPFGILAFDADRTEVESGQPVTLSWETFGGSSLRLFAGDLLLHSETDPSGLGSFALSSVERTTEYVLEVTNPIGVVDTRRLKVEIWEVEIDLQVSATTIRPGQPIEVTVDATYLDGGAPAAVFGNLPLVEVFAGHEFADISTVPGVYQHPINRGPAGTDSTVDITLPTGFTFPYMGAEHSSVRAFIDGYLSFSPNASSTKANRRLPFAGTPEGRDVHLAPFWDDLHAWNVGYLWSVLLNEDTYVIQWSHMSIDWLTTALNPLNLNFQVVLHRSGAFEFRYGTMAPQEPPHLSTFCFPGTCENEAQGSSATIGFQWNEGRSGQTLHFGGAEPGAKSAPFQGGLTNRSFRYEPFSGRRQFAVTSDVSQTLEFCSLSAGLPVCKELEVTTTHFGIDSFSSSRHEVPSGQPVTLSWNTRGGTRLNLLKGDTVVYSTDDLASIDEGSFTDNPSSNAVYTLEIRSGSFRERVARPVDVSAMSLTAQLGHSTHPGAPVTLSWNLELGDPPIAPVLVTPMEETTGSVAFADLSISHDTAARIIGANADNTAVDVVLDDFVFNYFGVPYTKIRVATDGYITFEGTGNSNPTNQNIPTTNATYRVMSLAPFWEDLHSRVSGGVFQKKVDPDTYVIQWSGMSLRWGSANDNEGDLNFMVVLRRDGSFEYRYGRMQPQPNPATVATWCYPNTCENETNGSSATIGYQIQNGTLGYLLHFGGTNRNAAQTPIPRGLSFRSWRFTPQTGSGSVQVRPSETRTYKVCAYDPASGDSICAPTLEADVPWGIDLIESTPSAPLAGESVSLAWKVMGLDTLRITANGTTLASYESAVPPMGSVNHAVSTSTTFVLEGESMGRPVRAERVVIPRTFDLEVTAPTGSFLLGEAPTLSWQATNVVPGAIAVVSPLSEADAGPGSPHAFLDVSGLAGAEVVEMSGTNGFATIALPFTFPYLGSAQQSVQVYVDGYLSFAGAGGTSNGGQKLLPEVTNRVHLAVYWKDTEMNAQGPERIWKYAPDPDTQIVQWKEFNATRGSTASSRYNLNFQVVLRSNGSFEYRYGEMKPPPPPHSSVECAPTSCIDDANGQHAVIGYQTADGALGSNLHIGTLEPPPSGFGEVSLLPPAGRAFAGGLSHRSFVYTPATSGSARVVVGSSSSHQVCASLSGYTQCKSVRLEARADRGDLAITELMIAPGSPEQGQWVEVRNVSNRAIDLEGFTLRSLQSSLAIGTSIPLAPGALATLATSPNVGFVPDYILGEGFEMDRLNDSLELHAGAMAVASVGWGISWTIPTGMSLSLDPRHHETGQLDHSNFAQWCNAGVAGNPGAIGTSCLSDDYTVDPRSNHPFIDIAATGTRFHDVEGTALLARLPNTGFIPRHFGDTYSRIWVATNGWLSFSNELPTTSPNTGVPSSLPRSAGNTLQGPLLAAFWDTLTCNRSAFDCRFYYERRQVNGSDVLILQWDGYQKGAGGDITFQAQLWENGDMVVAFPAQENRFGIGTTEWYGYEGGTSWIGIEAANRTNFETAHHKRILGLSSRSIHFQAR